MYLLSVAVCCGGGLFLATQKIQTYSLSPGLGVAADLFHRSHQNALITAYRCLYPVTSRRKDLYLTSNRVRNLFAPRAHLLYRSPSAPFPTCLRSALTRVVQRTVILLLVVLFSLMGFVLLCNITLSSDLL